MDESNISDGTLTIKGEKRDEKEEKKKDYYLSERRCGSFQRSFGHAGKHRRARRRSRSKGAESCGVVFVAFVCRNRSPQSRVLSICNVELGARQSVGGRLSCR